MYDIIHSKLIAFFFKKKEAEVEQETKMAKIASIEEAKQRVRILDENKEDGDSFIEKLSAKIMENIQISIE